MENRRSNPRPKRARILPCSLCPRSFPTQKALQQHIQALHQYTNVPQADPLVRHVPTTVEERPEQPALKPPKNIPCPACTRRFATRSALGGHTRALHQPSSQTQVESTQGALSQTEASDRDQQNVIEALQSQLQTLTVTPAEQSIAQDEPNSLPRGTLLKEDFVDDGFESYEVRHAFPALSPEEVVPTAGSLDTLTRCFLLLSLKA